MVSGHQLGAVLKQGHDDRCWLGVLSHVCFWVNSLGELQASHVQWFNYFLG